ncbi:sensor histidine kinase [Roseivivax sp.]
MQRIIIYTAANVLAGYYYSWRTAIIFMGLVLAAELYDAICFRNILSVKAWNARHVRIAMISLYIGTAFSAVVIASFSITLAGMQGTDNGHFLSMFLLFSASIFAAMNNRHFLNVLALRLSIYVAAILYIPVRDVWIERPPISSEIWLHLFTVIFVLAFILECARNFIAGYNANLRSRKALEEEHERTKAAFQAKTRFLSTVSHELRTPLTSIKGALEVINTGALGEAPEKMRGPLDVATRNSRRLAELVSDLLLLQKAEAGKFDFNMEHADLSELMTEIVERFRPFAENLEVALKVDVPDAQLWARIDKTRFNQVIANILSNATKFSRKDGGEVNVALRPSGDMIRIAISDNGEGIPEEFRDKVFQEFQQAGPLETRRHEGTGLGLSLSKRIIDAHDGRIWFTTSTGRGTTFFIELAREPEPIESSSVVAA